MGKYRREDIGGGFMKQETESTDDYYILSRDDSLKTPVPTLDDYNKRCIQSDFLVPDATKFVWGYVGKLSDTQASKAKARIYKELRCPSFEPASVKDSAEAGEFSDASLPTVHGFEFSIHKLSACSFLAQLSHNLNILSKIFILPKHFWFFPKTSDEAWEIEKGSLAEFVGRI